MARTPYQPLSVDQRAEHVETLSQLGRLIVARHRSHAVTFVLLDGDPAPSGRRVPTSPIF